MKWNQEKRMMSLTACMTFFSLALTIVISGQSAALAAAAGQQITATQMNPLQPIQQSVKAVSLIRPNGGERLFMGKTYVIQWQSKLMPYVFLRLRNLDTSVFHDIGTVPAGSGSYEWKVPHDLWPRKAVGPAAGNYKLMVQDPSGNPYDESDNVFQIQLPEIDLECRYGGMRYGANPGMDKIFKIQMRNNGTRVLQDVLFHWVIKKNGTMLKQDGAGYGQLYPNTVYEYEIPLRKHVDEDWRIYAIDFYLDPQNRQNEDAELRDDNYLSLSGQRL